MIDKEAELTISTDGKGGYYFYSAAVDLDKESVFVPVDLHGATGTLEIKRRAVVLHPANGPDVSLPLEMLVQYLQDKCK